MSCKFCNVKPVWKFTNQQQLCEKCFVEYFEKKVRSTIRKYKMPINPVNGNSLNAKVINSIIKNLPERKGKISEENLDAISLAVLNEMINGKAENLASLHPKNQPLYFLSDKEIELYAKIKKTRLNSNSFLGCQENLRFSGTENCKKNSRAIFLCSEMRAHPEGCFKQASISDIKGIKGEIKEATGKKKKINDFIKKIEQKNPDIRHNIIKALEVFS